MKPMDVVRKWVDAFNAGDVDRLEALYAENAVNHQVVRNPVEGRAAIGEMFRKEFVQADMTCIIDTIHEAGSVAIMEWSDPNGLRGCGFFTVEDGLIVFQRGYFDNLSFHKLHNLPIN